MRGPSVAGVELSSGAVRVVVARREDARLRVTGRGEAPVPAEAVSGGLVVDHSAVAAALQAAFTAAEPGRRSERVTVAIDGDDVRTYHLTTLFERENSAVSVTASEASRATRVAIADASSAAAAAAAEDPALRGVATIRLRDEVTSFALDGRALSSLVGYRGSRVEVWTDVALAPLVLAGAAVSALEAARRRAEVVSGAYALGRLLAESGLGDAGVLRLGTDVTALAVLRDGRVAATRAFGIGRAAIEARVDRRDADALVWAECVVASLRGLDGPPPARWCFVGVPPGLLALPRALGDAVGERRGGPVDIAPLSPALASRVYAEVPIRSDDLVAVGAAALAAGAYS